MWFDIKSVKMPKKNKQDGKKAAKDNEQELCRHVITESWLKSILTEYNSRVKSKPVKVNIKSHLVLQETVPLGVLLSDMIAISIRAEVDKEPKSYDFIIKLLPLDPFTQFFVTQTQIDLREVRFYSQVVRDFKKLQKQILTAEEPPIVLPLAKCYLAKYVPSDIFGFPAPRLSAFNYTNESVIVLEDLMKKGYRNTDFITGMTLKQAETAFDAISRIHALSLAMKVREGKPLTEKYDFFFKTEKAATSIQILMEKGFPELSSILGSLGDVPEIVESLAIIRARGRHLLEKLLTPTSPISAITHNEFWSNNMLFKKDKCAILDWQMVNYSQPTNDLAFFIISSLPPLVRREHESNLLDFYWDRLTQYGERLHIDIANQFKYDREKLAEDYKKSQLLALMQCMGSLDIALDHEVIQKRLMAAFIDIYEDGILTPEFINQLI